MYGKRQSGIWVEGARPKDSFHMVHPAINNVVDCGFAEGCMLQPGLLQQDRSKPHLGSTHRREAGVMPNRMRRRKFLIESSRVALSLPLLPLAGWSQGTQKSLESHDGVTLISDLE